MLARFIGGPHDGLELDHWAISKYCTVQSLSTPAAVLVFVLMPPTAEDWEKIVRGELRKDEVFGQLLPYLQVSTATGIEFHFDKDGEWLSEALQAIVYDDTAPEPTGIYFKCLRGDSEHLALTEPFSFAVQDSNGRNWICYPIPREDVESLSMVAHVADVFEADEKASKCGLSDGGTEVRIYFCKNEAELRERLAADPPRDETTDDAAE